MVPREQIAAGDTWELAPLYGSPTEWKKDFAAVEAELASVPPYAGTLGTGVERLKEAVECYLRMSRSLEKVYVYSHLRSDEDTANSENLGRLEQASNLYSRVSEAWSFFTPELLALPRNTVQLYLEHTDLKPYHRMLREILRYQPHTLSKEEEQLLAAGSEVFSTADKIFSQLNNADLTFGTLTVNGEEKTLSHGTFTLFLKNGDRNVRKAAFEQYYRVFDDHRNTIAATLSGSVKRDVYLARMKKYPSARERSLFADNVPVAVYDNLIQTVTQNLAPLHKYYHLRKTKLGLSDMKIYDTYVPLVPDMKVRHSYEEASSLIVQALKPLGEDYTSVLQNGLIANRWVDRYENKGKRSGAYSSGCYDSPPYILMNFKEDSLNDVFTLAHEAGHSMHSYYSCKTQPYQDHGYTIFVAEVASTFNEQLLCRELEKKFADDPRMLAYLVNHQIDDIKATLIRQTMFAEFEKTIHAAAENHEPLTIDVLRKNYRALLEKYFGSAVEVSELDELECLRIPHFYSAFYVYKYSTGISAAIALSQRVLAGGNSEREQYLGFLRSGCSKHPLELLKDAGVDMTTPMPIESALKTFSGLVDRLDELLKTL